MEREGFIERKDAMMRRSQQATLAMITLIPLEEDDFDTLGIMETVRGEVWKELSASKDYQVQMEAQQSRDAGMIVLIGELMREVLAQKDLLLALFQAGSIAIQSLARQGSVKKMCLPRLGRVPKAEID